MMPPCFQKILRRLVSFTEHPARSSVRSSAPGGIKVSGDWPLGIPSSRAGPAPGAREGRTSVEGADPVLVVLRCDLRSTEGRRVDGGFVLDLAVDGLVGSSEGFAPFFLEAPGLREPFAEEEGLDALRSGERLRERRVLSAIGWPLTAVRDSRLLGGRMRPFVSPPGSRGAPIGPIAVGGCDSRAPAKASPGGSLTGAILRGDRRGGLRRTL